MSTAKEQPSVPSRSWLTKSWGWLKSKFVASPKKKTRSSFTDLFFKNAATPVITQKIVVLEQEALPLVANPVRMQNREEIEQEFLPVIEALSKGDTHFKSANVKFSELGTEDKRQWYVISYYYAGNLVGFQKYFIKNTEDKDGYLAVIKIDEKYRGYGLGKLLMKAALAHLKSKGANRVSLMRGVGPSYSDPITLDRLFQSLGFKPLGSNFYELYLQQKSKI